VIDTAIPLTLTSVASDSFGYLIVSAISFLVGALIGWSLSTRLGNVKEQTVRRAIGLVLLAIYVISVLSEIWIPRYETPMLLHSIVGGTIGYLVTKGESSIIQVDAIWGNNEK
jgi:uncharacterized membrane protein YqgA involved in biofilm formation